jgi:hypothetical protein
MASDLLGSVGYSLALGRAFGDTLRSLARTGFDLHSYVTYWSTVVAYRLLCCFSVYIFHTLRITSGLALRYVPV